VARGGGTHAHRMHSLKDGQGEKSTLDVCYLCSPHSFVHNSTGTNPSERSGCWMYSKRRGPHRKRHVQQVFYCCFCIHCSGNVLPSRSLAMIMVFLPSRCLAAIQTKWKVLMKYVLDIGSDAVIYIPSFIKFGSGIQKLMGGGIHVQTQTYRQHGDRISLHLFF
jgi:hypothetical protein